MKRGVAGGVLLACVAVVAAVTGGSAQAVAGQVAERVNRVDDGTVRFSYDVRDDVEICEQGIRIGERRVWWRSRRSGEAPRDCRLGPAEVELRIQSGLVRDVEVIRSPGARTESATELGHVPAEEASRYLLSLARVGATERGAKDAILPAMLADVDEVWRDLVDLASDPGLRRDVRKDALFWLGQEAAEAVTQDIADVAFDEDEEQEIRDAAIFALSQRPIEEGLPVLMELSRTGDQAATRRSAMFWLAQSGDDRVIAFFEEILLARE